MAESIEELKHNITTNLLLSRGFDPKESPLEWDATVRDSQYALLYEDVNFVVNQLLNEEIDDEVDEIEETKKDKLVGGGCLLKFKKSV